MPLLRPARAQRKATVVLTANTYTSRSGEHTDLVIRFQHLCALLAPNSRLIAVHSAPIIFRSACTGGAQPPVARARAPVCPSLATPLNQCNCVSNVNIHQQI